MFGNQPVLSRRDDAIVFDTDHIQNANLQEVYVDRTNTSDFAYRKQPGASGNRATYVTAVRVESGNNTSSATTDDQYIPIANPIPAGAQKVMMVKVPNNAGPGSVLSVTAPDGSTLTVRQQ